MLIVDGSFDEVKIKMKVIHDEKKRDAKTLKSLYKKNPIPENVQNKITKLERQQELYSPAKTLPVQINGFIIIFKLYESFMKKLKGFETRIFFNHKSLLIEYWKIGRLAKGVLVLEDMSSCFEGFQHIPVAVLTDEQEARA
ncbi:hypothetical protein [Schinkia azotoformans]|uniref:hypothetical protein n=1 Tax=Schinkia azotoformans TaxID=1454 RepID=UPI002DBBD9CC|nr:hypothetical protein [Schinkia azotoformans]MEC1716638.1 hypothetical protein [Schinkia azotoformans]MEC1739477.1 hypothetical protein [Schinkia azotoformans]MEC1745453.1 hypothetical protein [Schinkia azotoformans]MEC1756516.1 hypothetical protein [Schinkia azotoformans]MEC1765783.1 hypothetical protein [Schinkia azotoformans]